MGEFEEKTIKFLVGKTIKDVEIGGFCFNITFTDGSMIHYSPSDGGYSSWYTREAKEAKKEANTAIDHIDHIDRFDCIITAGEEDPNHYGKYLDNELRVQEVVLHNVTQKEVDEWLGSPERLKRIQELEKIGRKRFGDDFWSKYSVNYYYTLAHKD